MLALLAKRAAFADRTIAWIGSTGFQSAAQREFDEREGADSRALLRRLKRAEILIFDDLGKGRLTDTVEAALFDLLETRSANNLVTHWSANPRPEEELSTLNITRDAGGILSRAMDTTGQAATRGRWEPIISRLIEDTLLVPVIQTESPR
jgi:DNA replication protein DnaC